MQIFVVRKQKNLLCEALLAAACALAACSSSPSQPDGGALCEQGSATCAAGTQCTNRDCVPTCTADGGCPAGLYCESESAPLNVCSPIQTVSCQTDTDCPAPQSCTFGGICYTEESQQDGSSLGCLIGTSNDLCAPDSICYQVADADGYYNSCIGLSHCSEDGGCPDPNFDQGDGTVCNQLSDGGYLFPGKERLCLYGFCADDSHCPTGAACFHATPGSSLGKCQDGTTGDACYTTADCFNATICTLDGTPDGGVDDGGSLGTCY